MRELLSSLISTRRTAEEQAKALAAQVNGDLDAIRDRLADVARLIEKALQAPVERKVIEARAASIVDDALAEMRSKNGILDYLIAPASRYSENNAAYDVTKLTAFQFAILTSREETIANLTREAVAAGSVIGSATSEANREKTVSKLRREALCLAAAEELLLRTLEETGAVAPRRSDADASLLTADDESLQRLAEAMP